MMQHDRHLEDEVRLRDMLAWTERAIRFVGDRNREAFLEDDLVQAAAMRAIEVIGEAARNVSEETRLRAPGIPWPLVVGMRHILAHEYGRIDPEIIFRIVIEHLPAQRRILIDLVGSC